MAAAPCRAGRGVGLACAMEGRAPDWSLLLRFVIGALAMRAAGCAFNDIVDRDIDAKIARTAQRPHPLRRDQRETGVGFRDRVQPYRAGGAREHEPDRDRARVSSRSVWSQLIRSLKRITWWPQAWLGLTFNWGARSWATRRWRAGSGLAPGLLYASGGVLDAWLRHDLRFAGHRGRRAGGREIERAAPRRACPARAWRSSTR